MYIVLYSPSVVLFYSDEGSDTAAETSVYILYNKNFSWSVFWDTFYSTIVYSSISDTFVYKIGVMCMGII